MNLRIADLANGGFKGITVAESLQHVTLRTINHVTIQPSEIQKVKIGIVCEVPQGYVLQINTVSSLSEKAGELFPAFVVIDSTYEGGLILAVRNSGRDPLNLMPGTPVGRGHLVKIEQLEIEEFEYQSLTKDLPKTKPQKKKPISFEVK